jgi:hypothetical protein
MRRPSACLSTLLKEGCFRPAVEEIAQLGIQGWNNLANRGA